MMPDRASAPAPLVERFAIVKRALTAASVLSGHGYSSDAEAVTALVKAYETLAALDGREAGWLPIESAPRDGKPLLLGKLGQIKGDVGLTILWASSGFWSNKWSNWDDGVGPSGLAGPTHWMPLPAPPARPQPAGEVGDE